MIVVFRRSIKQGGVDLHGRAFNGLLNGVEATGGGGRVGLGFVAEGGCEGHHG